jgi:type II secretion system protein C
MLRDRRNGVIETRTQSLPNVPLEMIGKFPWVFGKYFLPKPGARPGRDIKGAMAARCMAPYRHASSGRLAHKGVSDCGAASARATLVDSILLLVYGNRMLVPLLLAVGLTSPADLTLVGTVVSRIPQRSVAVLRSGGRTRVTSIGESAFGGRVATIGAAGVTLEYPDGSIEVKLAAGDVAAPPSPSLVATHPDAQSGTRTMRRHDVERRLGEELNRILSDTALASVPQDGQVRGLTLTRIADGTLLTDAGLRAGDVLTQVNEVPIDSMATLMSLWPKLQGESQVSAVVLRNGQPVTLTVNLR